MMMIMINNNNNLNHNINNDNNYSNYYYIVIGSVFYILNSTYNSKVFFVVPISPFTTSVRRRFRIEHCSETAHTPGSRVLPSFKRGQSKTEGRE